jgi:hypothetical protein
VTDQGPHNRVTALRHVEALFTPDMKKRLVPASYVLRILALR